MDRVTLEYDRKNAINLILAPLMGSISGTLIFLNNQVRTGAPIMSSHLLLLGVCLGAYAIFVGIRWYYYNSRTVGHLPMLSQREIRDIVSKEVEKLVE